MTDVLEVLRTDQTRWRTELVDLAGLMPTAEASDGADDLLFRLRSMVAICRRHILPRLGAQCELLVPAAVQEADSAIAAGFPTLLAEELQKVIDRLEQLQPDLLQYGATPGLRLSIGTLLATATALSTLALRFGAEVLAPRLDDELTPHEREQLVDAVHAYERSYR